MTGKRMQEGGPSAVPAGMPHPALTHSSLFTLEYLPVPDELSDHVTTFYHFRCDEAEVRDIQPASVGQLTVFPHGEGSMNFRDGRCDRAHRVNLLTPFSLAAPFHVTGPFHAIGAVLSPLGWAALTGLCAAEHGNRLYRAGVPLGEEIERLGQEICAAYREGAITPAQCVARLADYIGRSLRPVPAGHRDLIRTTSAWLAGGLNPPLDELHARSSYCRRQVQRLVERYFGLPPRALVRKYRALRAAAWLSLPQLSDAAEAELAEAFYDQPHMIREIQLFVGRTPARLGTQSSSYLNEMLNLRNFREIDLP